MINTFNVVMLPTVKESKIMLILTDSMNYKGRNKGLLEIHDSPWISNEDFQAQHLYIISDEEIKEGDWHINEDTKLHSGKKEYSLYKATKVKLEFIKKMKANGSAMKFYKVVASTDNICLNPEDVGYTRDWMPNIHESFTRIYIERYNDGKPIIEVDLEVENGCGNTCIPNDCCKRIKIKTREINNTVIIHQSKTYTKEEVKRLMRMSIGRGISLEAGDNTHFEYLNDDNWINKLI